MRKLAKNRAFPIRGRQAYGKRRSGQADRTIRPQTPWINDFFLNKKGPRHLAPGAFYLSKK
ncbi:MULTISPECIES: hypothetical protein [Bacillus]|jgi:hypothetical protein|uniref:hypothetical protein n=1 Tax=Bacillus TaxID=1386 RepID=UPI0002FBD239|nr:hypothetical protein [Bacillus licheniformis]KUL12080.1 hypothetical protein LI17339_05200 [Bacillus licheniformis LMG 17339]PZW81595.1 hypothetical protein DEU48_10566 [Bacillus sp. AG442]AOP17256.1 hypothetical protein BL1202_04336 [Bacillus licheniformis]ARC60851.1 hypothetical protein BaDB11_02211 [Bacillus licheniformis]ARC63473.1 hypothetical protein B14_00446 [Bacillus licheniformis]